MERQAGGPRYEVLKVRQDGRTSTAAQAAETLPFTISALTSCRSTLLPKISVLKRCSRLWAFPFSPGQTIIYLSGARTIGFAYCGEFDFRAYNFSSSWRVDPTLSETFVDYLLGTCPSGVDPRIVGNLDNTPPEPEAFDNVFHGNLELRQELSESDQGLHQDARFNSGVHKYAADQDLRYKDFVAAMLKLGNLNVKTTVTSGLDAEIRRDCAVVN